MYSFLLLLTFFFTAWPCLVLRTETLSVQQFYSHRETGNSHNTYLSRYITRNDDRGRPPNNNHNSYKRRR